MTHNDIQPEDTLYDLILEASGFDQVTGEREPLDGDEVEDLVFHIRNFLNEHEGNT